MLERPLLLSNQSLTITFFLLPCESATTYTVSSFITLLLFSSEFCETETVSFCAFAAVTAKTPVEPADIRIAITAARTLVNFFIVSTSL